MTEKKGVILEKQNDEAIILLPDGQYKKVKIKEHFEVGDYYESQSYFSLKRAIAAAVFLIILLGTVDFFHVTAYAQVSSGIELGLNRWQRVVAVKGNESTNQEVVRQVKGKTVTDAIDVIVKQSIKDYSLSQKNNNEIIFAIKVQGKHKKQLEEKLLVQMNKVLTKELSKNGIKKVQVQKKNNSFIVKPLIDDRPIPEREHNISAVKENKSEDQKNKTEKADNAAENREGRKANKQGQVEVPIKNTSLNHQNKVLEKEQQSTSPNKNISGQKENNAVYAKENSGTGGSKNLPKQEKNEKNKVNHNENNKSALPAVDKSKGKKQ